MRVPAVTPICQLVAESAILNGTTTEQSSPKLVML
jgi:hypothetical protein